MNSFFRKNILIHKWRILEITKIISDKDFASSLSAHLKAKNFISFPNIRKICMLRMTETYVSNGILLETVKVTIAIL